ncbi:MAG: xanthine dehydrogenase family protein subunit M [Melioribacteraceae bacterium]|nr:xanthine dehydrogenase family protein subunit M [Melioribacteraceae bacterium]
MNDFKYIQPENLNDAISALSKDSIPLAGGTDILSLAKENLLDSANVVNLKNIDGLDKIEKTNAGVRIGALTRLAAIASDVFLIKDFTILSEAASCVASTQIRNVGTIGGNIAQRPRCWYFRGDFDCLKKGGDFCYAEVGKNKYHAIIGGSPCYIVHPSDTAVALLTLDASLTIASKDGSRDIKISSFFVRPDVDVTVENLLKPGEILTHINIPKLSNKFQSAFTKFTERGVWDFALVSVGAVIERDAGNIKKGSLAFGGVAPIPWVDKELNKKLTGLSLNEDSILKFSNEVMKGAEPLEHNEYKVKLSQGLVVELLSKFI